MGFATIDNGTVQTAYMPLTGFTTVDKRCEHGNNTYRKGNYMEVPFFQQYMQLFDQLWNGHEKMQDITDVIIENISAVYAENFSRIYLFHELILCLQQIP